MAVNVCLTFDHDTVDLWITGFAARSPSLLSRGEFGAGVGLDRVLALLERHGITTTFFIPGMTAELYPERVKQILASGHELAAHGYRHERNAELGEEEERRVIRHGAEILADLSGEWPIGFRGPGWALSPSSIAILEELGFRYDSSLFGDDFRPYRPRRGDRVGEDGSFVPGQPSSLWEFPVAWELDDFPYFAFISRPTYHDVRGPDEVYALWAAEFDFAAREVPGGVFNLTLHPQFIGRGPRIAMLDRLIRHMREQAGVRFCRLADLVREYDAQGD